ncbi:hypothetical protein [Confluentibacter sediminis]|uniref:hypothetical protein n=1 Tax=Confluentibacter sediminis TaxID=2219045 RepID=UPI000DAD7C0E|nr:hypothetical protein [Confluentibacter sediminis]
MKNVFLIIAIALFVSCKQASKNITEVKELSVAEKIANAHGYEHWKNVSKIEFTFNVDRDSSHTERSWIWKPKSNDVSFWSKKDSIIYYNRGQIDSAKINIDKSFINDKFWLLVPFQLVWDNGTSFSEPIISEAPISKTKMNKVTLTYPSDGGGYTPGDAYDLYYGDDFLIKEWVFRRGNNEKPSIVNTFENYKIYNGLKLATEHKMANGMNIHFTNIKVTLE